MNTQLESITQIKLCDEDNKTIGDAIHSFIACCKYHGADLNHRNHEQKRPVDVAYKYYQKASKQLHPTSQQFIIKEKIYHAFLKATERIHDYELYYRLHPKGINLDIFRHVMQYYCALNVDSYIAESPQYYCHSTYNWVSYYDRNKIEKTRYKKELLEKEYKRLGIVASQPLLLQAYA